MKDKTSAPNSLLYQIAVSMLPGVGSVLGKNLVAYCGSAEAVIKAKPSSLEKIEGIGRKTAQLLKQNVKILQRAEQELNFIQKHNINALFFTESGYPKRLKHAVDSPLLLYYKGTDVLNHQRILAIVGTRKMTERGADRIIQFIQDLESADVMVVSGLAYGVDAQAQREAYAHHMPTVGVVAHGLDRIYPAANRKIAKQICENGGIITEFPSGTNPDAYNFPARNRIIAGMADAVLVVESAKKGGSLITADIANSYNRDVFAVPGRPDDEYAVGCNYLIKTNRASLVESAKDILYKMMWDAPNNKHREVQQKLFVDLSAKEKCIIEHLTNKEQCYIDELAALSQIKHSELVTLLLNLEFKGLVKCLPGNAYRRV